MEIALYVTRDDDDEGTMVQLGTYTQDTIGGALDRLDGVLEQGQVSEAEAAIVVSVTP